MKIDVDVVDAALVVEIDVDDLFVGVDVGHDIDNVVIAHDVKFGGVASLLARFVVVRSGNHEEFFVL